MVAAASLRPTPSRHDEKVARVVAQLRAHAPGTPVSLHKSTVSHQVPKARDLRRHDEKIDISELVEILEIDPERRICVAEAGVTFADLVAATLVHGLVPMVVPELSTITIGGAVAGCSLESTSFLRGGFADTCLAYEVITATGDVLECTPDNQHALVFRMMHGTFGTLGILSTLTFRLMPAKPYVRIEYECYASAEALRAAIEAHATEPRADFMDGIIHGPRRCVLCLGYFVDRAPYLSDYHWMKIYYRSTARRTVDYLTTTDYLFRYDRGVTNVRPRSLLGRLVLGKWMTSTRWLELGNLLPWLLRSARPTVTLDVFLPISRLTEFLEWFQGELGHYPLWCVPYRRVHDYEWLQDEYWRTLSDELFVDIAIYGMRSRRGVNAYRRIEEKLVELGGIKTLIAHNYYSETEFWKIWNWRNYRAVKAITDPADVFRDLYTKTCRAAMGLG